VIDAMTWQLIEYAELYEKGLPPIAGGALEQTEYFRRAARFIWNEQRQWRGA
jgi:hypothetical protein